MYSRTFCALLLMAAVGCYSHETIGVSKGDKLDAGDKAGTRGDTVEDPPAVAANKPKMPSAILGRPGEIVNMGTPLLGDMDGDGFDDFILGSVENGAARDDGSVLTREKIYLFYGRPEWPDQISTADADAVFKTDYLGLVGNAPGDLNGDGLADLLITREHAVQFVFGTKQRLQGTVAADAGAVWMGGELPPPAAPGLSTNFMAGGVGDVDGDGCADLRVEATLLLGPRPDGTGGGLVTQEYIVRGHGGEWTSGVWDPAWAVTRFGSDPAGPATAYASLFPEPAGDLNGDGRGDLIAYAGAGFAIFYGKASFPSLLTIADADAVLQTGAASRFMEIELLPSFVAPNIGDIDGDGRADLGSINPGNGTLGVLYGRDWSGDTPIKLDLELQVEGVSNQFINYLQGGDIDGDGHPELLVSIGDGPDINAGFDISKPPPTAKPGIYVLRGAEERRTGRLQLSAAELWVAPMATATPHPPGTYFDFQLVGDVDGDDGQDMIVTLQGSIEPEEAQPLYLVPSTPLPPQ